jgi:hypothetical protein
MLTQIKVNHDKDLARTYSPLSSPRGERSALKRWAVVKGHCGLCTLFPVKTPLQPFRGSYDVLDRLAQCLRQSPFVYTVTMRNRLL